LHEVKRKSVVLAQGSRRVTLYRNAWEGNTEYSASELRQTRRSKFAASKKKRIDQSIDQFEDDDFRAPPPPPPPILPPTDSSDDEPNLEEFHGGDKRGTTGGASGRVIYPDSDGELYEDAPGIYSDY